MKLLRFGEKGREHPGVLLDNGTIIDVSAFGEDYNEGFFGSDGISRLKEWLVRMEGSCPEVPEGMRLGPPLHKPSKLICVGLNYVQHAKETGAEIPREPILFFKASSALAGPNDPVVIPRGSTKTDWEVELAVIIGKKTSYVTEAEAMDHVAGYVLHNDYSERAYQLERGGQWVKGKSCDTFAPLGPFLATTDEIPDPHDLDLWLTLNGIILQKSNTSDLVFNVPQLISYISEFMTLLPGDVISTGTPSGVGLGMDPPRFLRPGDVVELGIEGLGISRQVAKAYEEK